MLKGFKEFILRGNVIDLAVAVVIGAAFTAIVNTIVSSIINPLIGLVFKASSLDKALIWTVPAIVPHTDPAQFKFGAVLGAVITFLAVAVVVYFVFVLPMNHMRERAAARAAAGLPDPEVPPTETELLIEIRDLLAAQQRTE
ncbi:mechanosensitive ion channel protein MscL [Microbacterium mangrovi]|uniref:Large-conductance mechanosensitive channel n=1 Tax=Microbacterium mangrovi TaxID=1348253 RepID=A0A0B2A4Z8_9MICO|nr:large conductance mechanosensitive channel protein MscL [Microbacterium mangrovi]KHK98589.1 mechanosensitive ion channel protein MscL [Microbacterium mangrovi]